MHSSEPKLVANYFDHGSTSFPKLQCVSEAMTYYMNCIGGTYGRAAYEQTHKASAIVFRTREKLARLIGAPDSSRIAFTLNATMALNTAIQGIVKPNGKVLISPLEHNSVMRPLSMMAKRLNITIETMPFSPKDGRVEPHRLEVDKNVCLAVVNLQSNVNGVIQPIVEIKKRLGSIPLLVDAAQAIGEIPMTDEISKLLARGGSILCTAAVAHAKGKKANTHQFHVLSEETVYAVEQILLDIEKCNDLPSTATAVKKALEPKPTTSAPSWAKPFWKSSELIGKIPNHLTLCWIDKSEFETSHDNGLAVLATSICRSIDAACALGEKIGGRDGAFLTRISRLAAVSVEPGEPSRVRTKLREFLKEYSNG